MSKTITVAIEGPSADRALGELLAIAGIQGNAQPVDPDEIERCFLVPIDTILVIRPTYRYATQI